MPKKFEIIFKFVKNNYPMKKELKSIYRFISQFELPSEELIGFNCVPNVCFMMNYRFKMEFMTYLIAQGFEMKKAPTEQALFFIFNHPNFEKFDINLFPNAQDV